MVGIFWKGVTTMPDKLTDNEIIKALEEWLNEIRKSYQTSIDLGYENISTDTEKYMILMRETLDLINRLQAKNLNLTSDLTSLQNDLTSLQAENERLNFLLDDAYENNRGLVELLERAKAEAYKDCIEKVKALFPSYNEPYQYWEIHEGADNLLNELVGDGSGN
jgi:hypothetical protein